MRGRLARTVSLKRAAVLLLPLLLLLAGCTGDPQDTLADHGDVSERIRDLFLPVVAIAVVVFVLVEGYFFYALLRYRRRGNETELPKQTHGSTPLEITWTIIPVVILAALTVPTLQTIRYIDTIPENPLVINVTAQQWWWAFQYEDSGVVTADQLVVPIDTPVQVKLRSMDVIHSFWVPRLAGKMDVVPNHNNTMWFNARDVGTYSGQCAEFCQLSHAKMKFEVKALSQADYQTWVQQQKAPAVQPTGAALQGAQVFFQQPCWTCHTVAGVTVDGKLAAGTFGPNLTHFASRDRFAGSWLERNDQDLYDWLKNPPAIKPGSKMPNYNLTDDQINQLIVFLQGLK